MHRPVLRKDSPGFMRCQGQARPRRVSQHFTTAGTPREGWDHATAWMRRILEDVWQLDLEVVTREFTLVGVNPALDQFADLARDLRQQAEADARAHGRTLAASRTERAAA